MGAVVVEADPVADGVCRMLDAVETLSVDALFLQCSDDAFNHAVLLGAVRCDELLLQPIAADKRRVSPTGEDEAIVGPQKELAIHLAQGTEPADQRMLQCAGSSRGLAGSRQMPAQKLAGMTVNHQGQRGPVAAPGPDATHIRRPALVRGCRDRCASGCKR